MITALTYQAWGDKLLVLKDSWAKILRRLGEYVVQYVVLVPNCVPVRSESALPFRYLLCYNPTQNAEKLYKYLAS